VRLPAAARPPAHRLEGAEVRPLGQVRLAEDHRSAGAQVGRDGGVAPGRRPNEREGAGGRLHLVARVDVVLEEDRDAVQGTEDDAAPALRVGVEGHGDGIRVDLDHRVHSRSTLVEVEDALDVVSGELLRGKPASGHLRLELRHGRLGVAERRGIGSRCPGRREQGEKKDRRDRRSVHGVPPGSDK